MIWITKGKQTNKYQNSPDVVIEARGSESTELNVNLQNV